MLLANSGDPDQMLHYAASALFAYVPILGFPNNNGLQQEQKNFVLPTPAQHIFIRKAISVRNSVLQMDLHYFNILLCDVAVNFDSFTLLKFNLCKCYLDIF